MKNLILITAAVFVQLSSLSAHAAGPMENRLLLELGSEYRDAGDEVYGDVECTQALKGHNFKVDACRDRAEAKYRDMVILRAKQYKSQYPNDVKSPEKNMSFEGTLKQTVQFLRTAKENELMRGFCGTDNKFKCSLGDAQTYDGREQIAVDGYRKLVPYIASMPEINSIRYEEKGDRTKLLVQSDVFKNRGDVIVNGCSNAIRVGRLSEIKSCREAAESHYKLEAMYRGRAEALERASQLPPAQNDWTYDQTIDRMAQLKFTNKMEWDLFTEVRNSQTCSGVPVKDEKCTEAQAASAPGYCRLKDKCIDDAKEHSTKATTAWNEYHSLLPTLKDKFDIESIAAKLITAKNLKELKDQDISLKEGLAALNLDFVKGAYSSSFGDGCTFEMGPQITMDESQKIYQLSRSDKPQVTKWRVGDYQGSVTLTSTATDGLLKDKTITLQNKKGLEGSAFKCLENHGFDMRYAKTEPPKYNQPKTEPPKAQASAETAPR